MTKAKTPDYSKNDVKDFISFGKNELGRNKRYLSFDYCYDYFQKNSTSLTGDNMEKSCMVLWSYLASWGMLRGSSALLQKGNYKVLEDTIIVIQKCFKGEDEIALPNIRNDERCDYVNKVVKIYKVIESSFTENKLLKFNPSDTLVTKIILGVFGVFPALDTNFCLAFGGGSSLAGFAERVLNFYKKYKDDIEEINIPVQNFNKELLKSAYPPAKLIDMFGFFLGGMVQGDKRAITIKNWNKRNVYVDDGIKKEIKVKVDDIGDDNGIIADVAPGNKHKVRIEFDNNVAITWKDVSVSKDGKQKDEQ